jgi:hypothetical protein
MPGDLSQPGLSPGTEGIRKDPMRLRLWGLVIESANVAEIDLSVS